MEEDFAGVFSVCEIQHVISGMHTVKNSSDLSTAGISIW